MCEMFNVCMDYLMGRTDDSSSPKLSDKDVEQLGAWELESRFHDIFLSYLALDDYGKNAVENLIQSEKLRCH